MPRFRLDFTYTADGVRGLLKEGGTARREATTKFAESVGARVEAYYFAFGTTDGFVIVDAPDNVSAATLSLIPSATGAVSVKTTVLLTAEEMDDAVRKHGDFRAPGT